MNGSNTKDEAMAADPSQLLRRFRAAPAAVAVIAAALVSGAWCPVPALAQGPATGVTAPDSRAMIDPLKPARQRNLMVRQTAAEAAASVPSAVAVSIPPAETAASAAAGPPPSLSLAIQFELNSSRVRPESGAVLGNLVAAMLSADLRNSRFLIEGYTDARGQASANKVLSQQRADEVRLYLVALGVHPARLRAVGKGSSEPANPRDPLAGDNRRVRVVTLE